MNILNRLYLFICWMSAIFILIAWPMREYNGTVVTYYDKIAHVILFGILAYLLVYLLIWFRVINIIAAVIISLILSALYSAFCEYVQSFVPGRDVSSYDFFAGLIGIIISLIIAYGRFSSKKA